ncbi:hypothetical protein [Actinomadura decatromicini]|uniref:Sigma-70 family RNA polymerase sigma factor n=1 Tax=Actinomadura decatromicini TaxID=2604572 RepID=A0A5D3FDF0_9ACTN|nr:hypothetical protein [Actinomadura decatromicini]TYK46193.1 hypothetical protein FXF68_28815 [Actinomadura decatromicini]
MDGQDQEQPSPAPEDTQWLHHQLDRIANTAIVGRARRLLGDVAPVLEPAWSIAGQARGSIETVGFLRRLGENQTGHNINADTIQDAAALFGTLNLTAPDRRKIWLAFAEPAQALVASIINQEEPDSTAPGMLIPAPRPRLPDGLLNDWDHEAEIVPILRRVLRAWCDIALHANGARSEVAQLTLAAALLARGAALDGDAETVCWFVDRWLGLAPTDTRVDGATAALLSNGWWPNTTAPELSASRDTVTNLRIQATNRLQREAKRQHRLHRPVWETQLRGAPIALLSDLLPNPENSFGSLTFTEAISHTSADVVDQVTMAFRDEQILAVLDTLPKKEEAIVRAAYLEEKPWTVVAEEFGLTRYELDKLRTAIFRKLRHPSRSQVLRDYLD